MVTAKKTWLSPTGVEALNRCPKCFWLQYKKGIRQPEGIVSRLANRFDVVLKNYFDIFRPLGELPPMVSDKLEGKLQNPFIETYFYHHNDQFGYKGKLDECLVMPDGRFTPIDFKTSSSDPREKEMIPAYQNQMDSYAWLLDENGKKSSGFAYLIYFYPDHGTELHKGFQMIIHLQKVLTNPARAKAKFINAVNILENPMPDSGDCDFCKWHEKMEELE